jgi:transmembrane sensor
MPVRRSGMPHPPPDDIDFALLDRFLAGECSTAEADLVRRWLATQGADARYVDAMRDALERRETAAAGRDADSAWARLARDTVDAERNADRLPPPLRLTTSALGGRWGIGRTLASPWLRAAAVVALAIGGGALWLTHQHAVPEARPASAAPAIREYATARGQRTELRLPDGTRVLLAPESRLGVPADFAVTRREFTLEGQAYFEVTHDPRKPFRVRAGNAVAYDLGTRFVVRAYRSAPAVQVVVAEGRVQLGAAGERPEMGAVLGGGDLGRLDSAGVVTTGRANLAAALAWTRGELVFADAPLSDVAAELGRWYDLDIHLADSALRIKRLTLTIGNESAPEALDAVALLVGARYQRHGQTVTFLAGLAGR